MARGAFEGFAAILHVRIALMVLLGKAGDFLAR